MMLFLKKIENMLNTQKWSLFKQKSRKRYQTQQIVCVWKTFRKNVLTHAKIDVFQKLFYKNVVIYAKLVCSFSKNEKTLSTLKKNVKQMFQRNALDHQKNLIFKKVSHLISKFVQNHFFMFIVRGIILVFLFCSHLFYICIG